MEEKMIDPLLIAFLALSFFSSYFFVRWWIGRALKAGLAGRDMNKFNRTKVAEVGGLPVLFSFAFGVLLYVGYRRIILNNNFFVIESLAVILTITLSAVIGIVDDILGWRIGLKQWQKPLLTLFAALPMMMINAGVSAVSFPFIGSVHLGLFYPLLAVPAAIVFSSNAFNMLAGYNGLEAGQGIIILSTLGYIAWQYEGMGQVAMLAGVMVACLIAFLLFNRFPARIFPGDSFNYMVGALIACVAILGNVEKIALFLLIPYLIEFILKAKGRFKHDTFGKPMPDNSLKMPYEKIYSLTHLFIMLLWKVKRPKEADVVMAVYLIELLLVLVVFIII